MIKPYTIYLFAKSKVLYAVAKAEIDNMETDATFGKGFKLIKDANSRLNTKEHIYNRARRSVVAEVTNALNAVQMFGEEVLNDRGELDWDKFKEAEMKEAWNVSRNINAEYNKKVITFPIIEISLKEAQKEKLI